MYLTHTICTHSVYTLCVHTTYTHTHTRARAYTPIPTPKLKSERDAFLQMAHDSGFHYTHHMVKQFLAAYTDSKSGQRGALDILWPRLVDQHNGPRLEETLFRGEDRQVVRAWTLMRVRRGTREEGRGKRG